MAAGKQGSSDSTFFTIRNTCQHWQQNELRVCHSVFLAYHLRVKLKLLKCQDLKKMAEKNTLSCICWDGGCLTLSKNILERASMTHHMLLGLQQAVATNHRHMKVE
ncbi:hypothetical protein [Undibacterium sp.]|uniref:hypothetical protein n=1 Tax=Undibacterium sp. TaxID=1914977 RepID=UPI00272F5090|nr:hypothetical protein [Undibacterium sp.]MDP1979109.1 hypothetical protein [Undibacterium sp.]